MLDKMQSVVGRALTIGGGAGSLFSGFLVMRGGMLMPVYWGVFVASLTALFVGWNMATTGDRLTRHRELARREQQVLAVVKARAGRVTDLQLAAESGWTLQESKQVLDEYVGSGVAELIVTREGDLVYEFRGMMKPDSVGPTRRAMSFTVENEDVIET